MRRAIGGWKGAALTTASLSYRVSSPSLARTPGPGPRRETGKRSHPAGKLATFAPEDSCETILAELKQSTGRAIKIEALNLKLQHENKLLTTRLASSNSRLLGFKALNLLEFKALNPNLLCEDKLLVPLTEFPGAKESVGAGTLLPSQSESLLNPGLMRRQRRQCRMTTLSPTLAGVA